MTDKFNLALFQKAPISSGLCGNTKFRQQVFAIYCFIYHYTILQGITLTKCRRNSANECELNRTISGINHVTNLVIRMLMNKERSRIRPEKGQE